MVRNYLITLEPDKDLYKVIASLKYQVREIVGSQKYLDDPPHTTIAICRCREISDFGELFDQLPKIEDLRVKIENWKVYDEPSGEKTPTCQFKAPQILWDLQMQVAEFFQKYKEGTFDRYVNLGFGGILKASLDKYGFPFVGEHWEPHIGPATLKPEAFEKAYKILEGQLPKGEWGFQSYNAYWIGENDEMNLIVKSKDLK